MQFIKKINKKAQYIQYLLIDRKSLQEELSKIIKIVRIKIIIDQRHHI